MAFTGVPSASRKESWQRTEAIFVKGKLNPDGFTQNPSFSSAGELGFRDSANNLGCLLWQLLLKANFSCHWGKNNDSQIIPVPPTKVDGEKYRRDSEIEGIKSNLKLINII